MDLMKFFKKIIGIGTAIICAASILAVGVQPLIANAVKYSDKAAYGDYLTYKKVDKDEDGTDDYISISKCDKSAVSAEIPAEIDGLPVRDISDWAFSNCSNLKSIAIPDSVTYIGIEAFDGTALLNNQTGVKYAGKWVIGCDDDVVSAEIKDGTKGIAGMAFYRCSRLTSVTIPDSVTSIGDGAFGSCESLASVTIPDSVTFIGAVAFYGCSGLKSVITPDNVTSIGEGAFGDCESLISITILNPECEIYNAIYTINNGNGSDRRWFYNGVIRGYEGSTAQAYAGKYGYRFEGIGEKTPVVTTAPPTTTLPTTTTETTIITGASTTNESTITTEASTTTESTITTAVSTTTESAITTAASTTTEASTTIESTITTAASTTIESAITTASVTTQNSTTTNVSITTKATNATKETTTTVTVVDLPKPTIYGDVNVDNTVNVADVVALNLYLLNNAENNISEQGKANADCVRDGFINTSDSTIIMNYVAELTEITELGSA